MEINPSLIGVWPNVALIPGTHTHATTGKQIPQPAYTIIGANNMEHEYEQPPELLDIPRMKLGYIGTFDGIDADKEQARKVLEESAELFGAWQEWSEWNGRKDTAENPYAASVREYDARQDLALECADVIQAIANLLSALDINDLSPYLRIVETKNAERGHVYLGVNSYE